MKIIQLAARGTGSRPPIQDWPGTAPPAGYARVPAGVDTAAMQACCGFVDLTLDGDGRTVTAIAGNEAAYRAYLDALRSPGPEEPSPSVEERLAALEAAVRQGLSIGGGEP